MDQCLDSQWLTEVVALDLVAAMTAQKLNLLARLHALRDDPQPQAVHHGDDGFRQGRVVGVPRQTLNEGAVDFDCVDGEALEAGERRIAGTEIIHGYPHAHALELRENSSRMRGVVHDEALGDLQLEQCGVEAEAAQSGRNQLNQFLVGELASREIDRHADRSYIWKMSEPRCVLTGFAQHPLTEGYDQPGFLRERDEVAGTEQAVIGMLPTHQGLRPCDTAGCDLLLRLVMQQQLVTLQSATKLRLQ